MLLVKQYHFTFHLFKYVLDSPWLHQKIPITRIFFHFSLSVITKNFCYSIPIPSF